MSVAKPNGIRYVQQQHTTDTDKTHGQASSVGVYLATVKDNKDPQNMGRLKVWVEAFGGYPEDEDRWITVSYASPFAGSTSIFDQGNNVTEYADTIKSFGMWTTTPAIDTRVLVTFASGRLDLGYWFACLYQTGTTGPIPGLPSGKVHSGPDKVRTNKNRKDTDSDLDKKVEHPLQKQLEQQGLEKDKLRGLTTSGADRESPSNVFGVLTPGQHQFVMDDGDKDGNSRNIRLRTVNGTQLLLDDTVGHVYIISKNGKNWIEMSVDGRIHLYGEDDISIHSEANINMFAGKSINMQAVDSINMLGAQTSSVYDSSGLNTVVSGDLRESVSGDASIKAGGTYIEKAAVIHMNGPIPPDAKDPQAYKISSNKMVTEAIMPVVPEHEPWAGHTGSIVPKGPGNQQMKEDPAPQQTAREPEAGDKGIPVTESKEQDSEKSAPVPVEEAKASPEVVDFIRDQNEYRGYPYEDGEGTSVGYGSPVDNSKPATQNFDDGSTITRNPDSTVTSTQATQYENLTGSEVTATDAQQQDAATFREKKLQELSASKAETEAKLQQLYKEGNYGDFPATPGLTPDQRLAVIEDAKSKGIPTNQALRNANMFGYGLPPTSEMKIQQEISATGRNSIPGENTYNGVSKERAEQLLAQDVSRSEIAVRNMLSSAGVSNVAPKQFDGLVSMHNQLGDSSYAYVQGEKINLTPLYANGEWNKASALIAADERDRPRRQAEANIMVNGDYGNPSTADQVVNRGLMKTNALYQSNRLNEQTSNSANYAQQQAAANSWSMAKGFNMPALNFAQRLSTTNSITNPISLATSKWAY
jgi:GH24 family phage-related lysozyme (muramidase)